MWHTKEKLKGFYSLTLKLLLWPLCGVTAPSKKMQLLSSELSFLCAITIARRTTAVLWQRAQVVGPYVGNELFTAVQRNYQRVYRGDEPDTKNIKAWFCTILPTGSVLKQSGGMRLCVSEEKV